MRWAITQPPAPTPTTTIRASHLNNRRRLRGVGERGGAPPPLTPPPARRGAASTIRGPVAGGSSAAPGAVMSRRGGEGSGVAPTAEAVSASERGTVPGRDAPHPASAGAV